MSVQIPFYKVSPPVTKPDLKSHQDQTSDVGDAFFNILQQSAARSDQTSITGHMNGNAEETPSLPVGELELSGDTADFKSLGVLLRRLISQVDLNKPVQIEAVLTSESLQSDEAVILSQNKGAVSQADRLPTLDADGVLSRTNVEISQGTASIFSSVAVGSFALQTRSEARQNPSPVTIMPPLKVTAAKTSLSQLRSLAPPQPVQTNRSSTVPEGVRAEAIAQLENGSEGHVTDVDISLSRGETGLIIVIKLDWADSKRLKQLEDRLTRLVESEGEKVERLDIQTVQTSFSQHMSQRREGT